MREKIIEYIRKELIGPDPVPPHIQGNGEEILINEPPRLRYGAGILFPQSTKIVITDTTTSIENSIIERIDEEISVDDPIQTQESQTPADLSDDSEEEIGLANNYLPAAMGFSCFSKIPQGGFKLIIRAATYQIDDYEFKKNETESHTRRAYYRIPLDQEIIINSSEVPIKSGESKNFFLKDKNNNNINLTINLRNRSSSMNVEKDIYLFTFTLINCNEGSQDSIRNEDCFFQVSFSVSANQNEKCFYPYKSYQSKIDNEDELSNKLLFRKKKIFAVGHGCSPKWDDNETQSVATIITESIPVYEIKPIIPTELSNISLDMFNLSDLSDANVTTNLDLLNDEYESWINKQEEIAKSELKNTPQYLETATKHIEKCRSCLTRMRNGVELLRANIKVRRAFQLMNRAMLLQQLRYSIHTRNWLISKQGIDGLEDPILDGHSTSVFPNILDKNTWPRNSDGNLKVGSWRPFQLAFILMNLNSMAESNHNERQIIDLIWFPTGGGKTEAYLGLSAFTIFLKRQNDKNDSGTTVLMRYTLRLLTAQQFQRAASLICACDYIRKENENELGKDRITIGLWVGELTPNSRQLARTLFQKMESGEEKDNPFVILKCPWCGTQMGLVETGNRRWIKGYRRRGNPQTIVYRCENEECDFSKEDNTLPCVVIDEDIYDTPPTLLVGTVDKFAMLTWKPEARTIFGFREESKRLSPPELVIQDELHLISGPLGSMVGLYETMIEELCTLNKIRPKIIASSATLSRAKEQIHRLYGRGEDNVNIFPVQCLNAGESFFAYENNKAQGRKYIGIFASGLPSHATAQIRIISAILQAVKSIPTEEEKLRDPYWTVLSYFNSIRELGHAATLIRADIREYMNSIWIRKSIKGDERRFINRDIELTSRINSTDIPDYLEQLSKSWTGDKSEYPVDICLATNMISVGVDIQRLGLMTVIGQPKTTSEYIQATSRVGRSKSGPGLIFTIYNCSKPRDRSHFEHFQEYHSKIYSKVEPTSVTPFSAPTRERALHSILIGLIRIYSEKNRISPKPFPDGSLIKKVTELIYERVKRIDEEELTKTINLIAERLNYWQNELPLEYGSFGVMNNIPLIYPAGTNPSDDIKSRAWPTPTSMRNVDATCDAIVVNNYINIDN